MTFLLTLGLECLHLFRSQVLLVNELLSGLQIMILGEYFIVIENSFQKMIIKLPIGGVPSILVSLLRFCRPTGWYLLHIQPFMNYKTNFYPGYLFFSQQIHFGRYLSIDQNLVTNMIINLTSRYRWKSSRPHLVSQNLHSGSGNTIFSFTIKYLIMI